MSNSKTVAQVNVSRSDSREQVAEAVRDALIDAGAF